MRIAVIEDEPPVARRLDRDLRRILGDQVQELTLLPTLPRALEHIQTCELDLVFLDLNLNGRAGFDLLAEASAARFQTVVVSAHEDQAIRAFEYGVVDFVGKPWTEERLRMAVERALGRIEIPTRAARLVVRTAGRVELVDLDRVLAVRGADDYTELVLDDGSTRLSDKTLAALERVLPARFVRVHRSWIVSLDRVRGWEPLPGGRAALDLGHTTIPVGRSYHRETMRRLNA